MPTSRPPILPDDAELQNRLRKWLRWYIAQMKANNRNQTDVAESLGVSTPTITNKKKDQEGMSVKFFAALAIQCGQTMEYMIRNDPPIAGDVRPLARKA